MTEQLLQHKRSLFFVFLFFWFSWFVMLTLSVLILVYLIGPIITLPIIGTYQIDPFLKWKHYLEACLPASFFASLFQTFGYRWEIWKANRKK